jgi:hypothetical protein
VLPVELVTMIWRNVEEDSPCKKSHPRRRLKVKVISQNRGKGGLTRRDRGSKKGTRHSALIVVRVDIKSRSVGHFIHSYVRSRTGNILRHLQEDKQQPQMKLIVLLKDLRKNTS